MASHLKEYLDYYQTLNDPKYAVLVNGAWGIGKTYQVLGCIPDDERYYVSLFGLNTIEQVHGAIYAAYAPNMDKLGKSIGAVADAGKEAGSWISLAGSATGWLNAALRRQIEPDRTLVLDDLERCNLDLKQLIGIVSTYLEQHGFRVVAIAEEDRLAEQHEGYREAKEKIVGQTIRVEPQIDVAFDHFLREVKDDDARVFLETNRSLILERFRESGATSLRILRHLVEDFTRLYSVLEAKHTDHADAMKDLLGLFCGLNIEVRSGNLKADDLRNRANARSVYGMQRYARRVDPPEEPPFLSAADKYPSTNLESQVLTDDVLDMMFIHGRYDQETIRASVYNSVYFVDPGEVPPWKIVINFDELDDETVANAVDKMSEQFKNREVTGSGEMLHMFCLRMMISLEGIIHDDLDAIRDQNLQYIDDLLEAGTLLPRELDWRWHDEFNRAHGGYGYWIAPETQKHFTETLHHLKSAREMALERRFPEISDELLELMRTDGQEFYAQVCHTNTGPNHYVLIPVLASIPPESFVEVWLGSPRHNWNWISRALKDRLQPPQTQRELAGEVGWGLAVLGLLEAAAKNAEGFSALRIRRTIPNSLRELANE